MKYSICGVFPTYAIRIALVISLLASTACTKQQTASAPAVNLNKLAEQTQRLWDTQQVANLMGLYVHFNRNGMDADTVGLFAIDDEDVAVEFPGEGRYVGKDEVTKRLTWNERMQRAKKPEFYGRFMEHMLTSPIIVVADDGLTAKALWSDQIYEAMNVATGTSKPNVVPAMATAKFAVDFKKVRDRWRIWHLHLYPTLQSVNGAAWTKSNNAGQAKSSIAIAEAAAATQKPNDKETGLVPPHASKDNGPFWAYSADQPYPPREQPLAPRPYANWTATFSY